MQTLHNSEVGFFEPHEAKAAELVDQSYGEQRGWKEADFREFYAHDNHAIIVYREHGSIIGYLAYAVAARQNEIRIIRVLVHSQYRRQGVATSLLDCIKARAKRNPGGVIKAMARERDLPRQLALKKAGFTARFIKKECFTDTGEDGYVFMLEDSKTVSV